MMEAKKDLKSRVDDFNMLRLPGQPMGMHMGTSYLVNDLWREVDALRAELAKVREDYDADHAAALAVVAAFEAQEARVKRLEGALNVAVKYCRGRSGWDVCPTDENQDCPRAKGTKKCPLEVHGLKPTIKDLEECWKMVFLGEQTLPPAHLDEGKVSSGDQA